MNGAVPSLSLRLHDMKRERLILLSMKHNTFLLLVNANNHQPFILLPLLSHEDRLILAQQKRTAFL